ALLGKQHILVAGSGPLPITGINITQMGTRVTCLERDPKAFFIGEQIIHLAGHVIDSINYDIMDLDNLDQYDAIVGVVLLGICPNARRNYKAEVIQHILANVRRGTTVALRVPHGLGQLLYPSVELDSVEGFDIKRFHDAVLNKGAVPLDILESQINAWIAAEKNRLGNTN
ncbi:MAG: hypothetical protein IH835_09570, partial [Proteobacteria bacterium]|nr:hypothetical protein [Pseudomonadota bacterium]